MHKSISDRSADFWYPVFYFFAGVLACWVLNPLRAPIQMDNQVYFYISERAASGIPPHLSEFDPKNALSMFVTAATIWLGRHVGADDLMAARFVSILAVAGSCSLLWISTHRIAGNRAAAHVAALAPIAFLDFLTLAVAGARPKVFLVFFIALWLLTATRTRPFFLGMTAAFCFLVWQPALLLLAASFGAMLATGQWRASQLARLLAGAALPIGLYELYFWWHGALAEQIYQSLIFAAEYRKNRPPLAGTFFRLFAITDGNLGRRVAMNLFVVSLVVIWVRLLFAPGRSWQWLRDRQDRICLLLGAHATTAFCFLDYQGFPDRFFVLPFAAAVDGVAVACALRWLRGRLAAGSNLFARLRSAAPWQHVLPVALTLALLATLPNRSFERRSLEGQRAAARYVGQLLAGGKTVYVMSPLHLLAMNRASNFLYYGFFPARIRSFLANRVEREGRLLPLKDGKLPDVLLQTRMTFGPNRKWIEKYYRPVESRVMKREHVKVLERRPDVKPPAMAKGY